MRRYFILFIFHAFICLQSAFAFNFQEHKYIGNAAFLNTYHWLQQQSFFRNEDALKSFFSDYLNIRTDTDKFVFTKLSYSPNQITYGDLNGLSGDHEQDPLTLAENLEYRYSILNRIVLIQNQYGDEFYTNAPDKLLFKQDNRYGFFALINYNHFYYYGESLTNHLRAVEKDNILALSEPKNLNAVIQKLNKSHSINTYVTLHCAAMLMADKAGEYYRQNEQEKCQAYLFYAIIFNAFADHFIEDACAAGHLVVNRSYLGSVINNKPLHDFYNRIGLNVVDINGNVWKQYGDNYLLKEPNTRDTASSYLYFGGMQNQTFEMASRAVTASLKEIFTHFIQSATGSPIPFDIPDNKQPIEIREAFYVKNCKALSIIPLPFNSHMDNYFIDANMLDSLKRYNWLLPYRNYIRHRVANTLILDYGYGQSLSATPSSPFAVGLRFILSGKKYSYADRLNKKGTFDQWRGLTLSYHFNYYPPPDDPEATDFEKYRHQVQAGFYRCFDYWVGRNRFLNFHGYLEGGVQIIGNKVQAMITPSVGMELLPLAGFNRKPLPRAVSIPLQIILPVKFLVSYQMIHGQKPEWIFSNQIDLVF